MVTRLFDWARSYLTGLFDWARLYLTGLHCGWLFGESLASNRSISIDVVPGVIG